MNQSRGVPHCRAIKTRRYIHPLALLRLPLPTPHIQLRNIRPIFPWDQDLYLLCIETARIHLLRLREVRSAGTWRRSNRSTMLHRHVQTILLTTTMFRLRWRMGQRMCRHIAIWCQLRSRQRLLPCIIRLPDLYFHRRRIWHIIIVTSLGILHRRHSLTTHLLRNRRMGFRLCDTTLSRTRRSLPRADRLR